MDSDTLPQIMKLTTDLEKSTERRLKVEADMVQTKQNLALVSDQKNSLMKTAELYEADKRELEQEVCVFQL